MGEERAREKLVRLERQRRYVQHGLLRENLLYTYTSHTPFMQQRRAALLAHADTARFASDGAYTFEGAPPMVVAAAAARVASRASAAAAAAAGTAEAAASAAAVAPQQQAQQAWLAEMEADLALTGGLGF